MGRVCDNATGEGISDALVSVGGAEYPMLSGGDYLCVLDPGTYTVTASAPGYTSMTSSGVEVPEAGTVTVDFELESRADYNGDGVVDQSDLLDRRTEMQQELQEWIQGCWAPREGCGDYNGDEVIDQTDLFERRGDVFRELQTWIQECWLPAVTNPRVLEDLDMDAILRGFQVSAQ